MYHELFDQAKAVRPSFRGNVLLFFCIFTMCQAPQADTVHPPVMRVFRKRQMDRYAVEIDTDGTAGKGVYEFDWKVSGQQPDDRVAESKISVAFLDLRATINDQEAPVRKSFGAANFRLTPTGFPLDLSIGGDTGLFVLPLLSWYLPKDPLGKETSFAVPETVFDNVIHVSGEGSVKSMDDKAVTFEMKLQFQNSSKPAGETDKPPKFSSSATFNRQSGTLMKSEGEIDSPSGVVKFHIRHLR